MNIPNEAVEAAHKAWREQNTEPGTIFEYNMRAALEVAAPYFMAEALEEAASKFQVRSETFLATMQNMVGLPEYTNDDVLRYGAYSAEARVAAIRLRSSAEAYRDAEAGE